MSSHVEYHKFRRGETCTEEGCRAHRFYIEDGMKFCQRGHAQANFTLTQQDEDDFGTQGKKSRKKREEKERTQRVFTGEEAIDLYLQCFQLILWKQCHWLVTVKGFPKELKTVVRDLWGLRVRMFLKLNEDKTGYSSGTGTSGLSSASEGEDPGIDESQRKGWLARRRKRMIKASKMVPQLAETLTFSYLGILLLRLPFTLGDIFIWAKTQELPYFRAIKEIPKEMRLHLPSHYHASLEVRSNMKGEDLQATTLEVVKFFNHHFEMEFPPLNTPLLIFRHIRDLGLPVEIYCAVRRLAELLGIDFTYPVTPKRRQILDYPELQIMCLIVIATKLGQPFDNVVRHPTDESDPTTVKIDWQKWVQVMAEEPSKGIKPGSEIDVTDVDILKMDGKKLDDYLDWYQRTWIDDRKPKMAEQILELFPLQDLSGQPEEQPTNEKILGTLKEIQSSLTWQKPVQYYPASKEGVRAGHMYQRWRTIEELPEAARVFYEKIAHISGVPLQVIVLGVLWLETQLQKWTVGEKRKIIGLSVGYDLG